MSLYNSLFGQNDKAPLFLKILDIDQGNGKWESGRFRDIYLNEDGTKILLYTRNGGGNRECWSNKQGSDEECLCAGCIIEYHLPKHPNYLTDYDDDFDCTYATIEFSVPEQYLELTKQLATGEVIKPSAKWEKLFADMSSGNKTPEVEKGLVGKICLVEFK